MTKIQKIVDFVFGKWYIHITFNVKLMERLKEKKGTFS